MSCTQASVLRGGIEAATPEAIHHRCALIRSFRCWLLLIASCSSALLCSAQTEEDTIVNVYQLGEVVVHGRTQGLQLEGFITQVMEDTTFYHAFLNTKYHPHHVKSELAVRNKKDKETAYLYREGRLVRNGPMAELVLDSAREMGKLRKNNGDDPFPHRRDV